MTLTLLKATPVSVWVTCLETTHRHAMFEANKFTDQAYWAVIFEDLKPNCD